MEKETEWRRNARSRSGPKVVRAARRHNDVYGCFSRRRSRARWAPIGSAAHCARAELRQSDTKIERRLRSLALPGLEMRRQMAEFGRTLTEDPRSLLAPATGERGPLRSSKRPRYATSANVWCAQTVLAVAHLLVEQAQLHHHLVYIHNLTIRVRSYSWNLPSTMSACMMLYHDVDT